MEQTSSATLTRKQIKDIFRANKGSVTQLADELGITHPGVSMWLRGKSKSARIAKAAFKMASELQRESEKVSAA